MFPTNYCMLVEKDRCLAIRWTPPERYKRPNRCPTLFRFHRRVCHVVVWPTSVKYWKWRYPTRSALLSSFVFFIRQPTSQWIRRQLLWQFSASWNPRSYHCFLRRSSWFHLCIRPLVTRQSSVHVGPLPFDAICFTNSCCTSFLNSTNWTVFFSEPTAVITIIIIIIIISDVNYLCAIVWKYLPVRHVQ